MVIGGIDREETKKVQKKQSRSELLKKRQENEHRQASCTHSSLVDNLEESDSEDCSANDGDTSYSNVRVECEKTRQKLWEVKCA